MNSLVIHKQLIINSMALPLDLINEIKDFLFYDKFSAESRQKKRGLVNQFKLGLWYQPDFKQGHWALAFRYETQIQAINCVCCGQFIVANADPPPLPIACNCDEEYAEEIINQVRSKMDIHAGENWDGYMDGRYYDYELQFYD
jgi:hypothetical protein